MASSSPIEVVKPKPVAVTEEEPVTVSVPIVGVITFPVATASATPVATGVPVEDVKPAAVAVTSALPVGTSSPIEVAADTPDNPFELVRMKSPLPQEDVLHPSGKDVPTPLFQPVRSWLLTIVGFGKSPSVDVKAFPVAAYSDA